MQYVRLCGGARGDAAVAVAIDDAVAMIPVRTMPVVSAALCAAVVAAGLLQTASGAGQFGDHKSCEECVAAGFGWHQSKAKCGGFANTDCAAAASLQAAASGAHPELSRLASEAASACAAPCGSAVECYGGRVHQDLARWKGGKGLAADHITSSRAQIGSTPRLTHYQIIGGKLYRQPKCMFEPRCRGIEYFLLWLLAGAPRRSSARPCPHFEMFFVDGPRRTAVD